MGCFRDTINRPEIVEAIQLIVNRYHQSSLTTSIEFPPRFGKSTVIRGSALELRNSGAPLALCICPWIFLAKQIKKQSSIQEMYTRYGIDLSVPYSSHRVEAIDRIDWYEMSVGVPTLLSATIGLILANKTAFLDGLEYCAGRSGARPVVFFDESHLVKKAQSWGALAKDIQDRNGYIITLTGTPVPGMPGFEEEIKDTKDVAYTLIRPRRDENGEKKWFEEKYEGKKSSLVIKADKSVKWEQAWRSNPQALEQVNAIWINSEVFDENGSSLGWLNELGQEDISGFLKPIIESDDVTNKMAYAGMQRLLQRRVKTPQTQMLVITGADVNNNGSNQHARKFKRAIQDALIALNQSSAGWRISIATSVDSTGEPDKQSLKAIERFQDGLIDVLIVKMMGIVGLDNEKLKVLAYASTVRKGPLVYQAISRPLTVWSESNDPADIIMPCDPKMRHIYNVIVKSQGGEKKIDVDLVDEKPVPPPDLGARVSNQGAEIFGYSDHKGGEYSGGDQEYILMVIKTKWHVGNMTDVEILRNNASGAFPVTPTEILTQKQQQQTTSTIIDLDENLESLIGKFGEKAKAIISKHIDFRTNNELWREKVRFLQAEAKRICHVENRSVPKIDDAVLLKRLIEALDQAERVLFHV